VLAFGVPDSDGYAVPFRTFFRKNLSMSSGTTRVRDWIRYLRAALALLAARPLDGYVTHELSTAEAQRAYELAATPAPGRLKVVMT
jgi:L-iditol 2-dehydrogenase